MKRSVATAVVVTTALAGVASAEAVVKRGSYSGQTAQGYDVSFRVVKIDGEKRLSNVEFSARLDCTDGDSFVADGASSSNFTITRRGRFGYISRGASGASEYTFRGRIKGRKSRARGKLEWTARFNEDQELDPDGSIVCETGTVRYRAKR